MSVTTQQITPEIGLEVTGLAGHELVDPARAAECQAALDAHGVVVYREAGIGDADLLAFTEMLGTVVIPKMGGLEEHPGVDVISLDPAESSLAKYRRSTIFWHLDGTTDELPQKATLLTALVVADEGGDTEFAHTYAAYDALPEDEKARLDDLRVEHSLAAAQLMFTPEPTEKQRAAWDQVPSRVHPLVWRRRDGRRSLLIGSTAGRIVGPTRGREPGPARPPARVGDPAPLRPPSPLAPGRSRRLGQHRPAPPGHPLRGHLPPAAAPHHPRGRGSDRLIPSTRATSSPRVYAKQVFSTVGRLRSTR